MYKTFNTLEELCQEIERDKHWTGAESSLRNRYPLRFVLFENFKDFHAFTEACQNQGVYVQSIEGWLAEGTDDLMLTYSQLAERFEEYVSNIPVNDFVIAPFSEVARFFDNEKYAEFDSLVKSIRLINATEEAQTAHQRIYVPIIGMQGKMNKFKTDPNIHIWELNAEDEGQRYRLIISAGGTYGVKGLETTFTVCRNMRQWIALWKNGSKVKHDIICTSKAISDNAYHAKPDNAFEYEECRGAFDFLTKGLGIDFGVDKAKEEETPFWEQLAACVYADGFDFSAFINHRFNTLSLDDDRDFMQIWLGCHDDFSRWLLKIYYMQLNGLSTYLGRALMQLSSLATPELVSTLATLIFDEPFSQTTLSQRLVLLKMAANQNIVITEIAEQKVNAKLRAIAVDPSRGYYQAMKYMTPLTESELVLMIEWLASGYIEREDVRELFSRLYLYTERLRLNLDEHNAWVNRYFDEYRMSKLANEPKTELLCMLKEKNASVSTFYAWRDSFKTVKTILHNRTDIDVFYWIDGLGIDWIPFVANVIEKHKVDGVYLNEIYVGTADLPTCTANNKQKLQELSNDTLNKIGDLDTYAHTNKKYPQYIIKEMGIVEEAITTVLSQYNGKKIAFVSDHGISYMPQLANALNIGNVDVNHEGRCGRWKKSNAVPADSNYVAVDEDANVCALTYNSLGSKTPAGHGAHGGATPEEVLVPIIIVSAQRNASTYSAVIIDNKIETNNPVVKYRIKGLLTIDTPLLNYNGTFYNLHFLPDGTYESEKLNLVATTNKVTLVINDFKQTDTLVVNTGVEEIDLFD